MKTMPHRDFYTLVKTGEPVKTRNRLLSASDKELYLAVCYLARPEQEEILRLLSPEKAGRIRDIFARGIRFGQDEYRTAVNHLIRHLSEDSPLPPLRSWYRPGQR